MVSTYSPAVSSHSVVFKTIAVDGLNIAYRGSAKLLTLPRYCRR